MKDISTTEFEWVMKVLESCHTESQLQSALKCFDLWEKKYKVKGNENKTNSNYFFSRKFLNKFQLKSDEISESDKHKLL